MPIPSVKTPRPPRRAPAPAANLTQEVSADTYAATHLQFQLSGVAVISKQLIETKDAVNDVKIALATAGDTVQRISTNPAILGDTLGDSSRGGIDIQSLEFATATRAKLGEQEQKQDAHYTALRELAIVGQETRKAANDPSLRRYRESVECQLATSTFPGERFPREHGIAARPITPEEQQALLNPFTTRRQSKNSEPLATVHHSSSNNSNCASNYTAPNRPSAAASLHNGGEMDATLPATGVAPPLYNRDGLTAPPSVVANDRYHPEVGGVAATQQPSAPPSASPPMPQPPYGGAPGVQGGGTSVYSVASAYPPPATPAATAAAGYPMGGNAGYYGASPYSPQGQQQSVYGQYGQRPPMSNLQGNGRPTYMAL